MTPSLWGPGSWGRRGLPGRRGGRRPQDPRSLGLRSSHPRGPAPAPARPPSPHCVVRVLLRPNAGGGPACPPAGLRSLQPDFGDRPSRGCSGFRRPRSTPGAGGGRARLPLRAVGLRDPRLSDTHTKGRGVTTASVGGWQAERQRGRGVAAPVYCLWEVWGAAPAPLTGSPASLGETGAPAG